MFGFWAGPQGSEVTGPHGAGPHGATGVRRSWGATPTPPTGPHGATRGGATRGHRGSEVVGGGPHPTNGATRGHTGRGHTGPQGFGGRGGRSPLYQFFENGKNPIRQSLLGEHSKTTICVVFCRPRRPRRQFPSSFLGRGTKRKPLYIYIYSLNSSRL